MKHKASVGRLDREGTRRYVHVWFCPTCDRGVEQNDVGWEDKKHIRGEWPCYNEVWVVSIPTDVVKAFHTFWQKKDFLTGHTGTG